MVQTGQVWRGHEGAARFHQELFDAFPDVRFDLQNIVIGPQGVYQEIALSATHQGDWLDFPATGRRVAFTILVLYPWDMEQGKFTGERVYIDAEAALRGPE